MSDKIRVEERITENHWIPKAFIIKNLKNKLADNIFKLLEDGNRYVFKMTIKKEHNIETRSYIYTA